LKKKKKRRENVLDLTFFEKSEKTNWKKNTKTYQTPSFFRKFGVCDSPTDESHPSQALASTS
jgi:hypothetical protein